MKKLTPYQLLLLGYIFITLTGAMILSLPISSAKGTAQPFLDALFLASSGISTSGLTVVDIGSYYSFFGQIVLMVIFQIGGIGYMTFIIFTAYVLGMGRSLKTSLVARESLVGSDLNLLENFFRKVLFYTCFFELSGTIILSLIWLRDYPLWQAFYFGLFHSISTFCTAGFGLFPDSLMKYQQNILLNVTINILSLAGGLGFFVLDDIRHYLSLRLKKQYPARLAIHTKLVLITTFIIIMAGTAMICVAEDWQPITANNYEKGMHSFFQAVSASTTDGFNTLDIGKMSPTSWIMIMLLMFVGASPGSTGGGIKTTTFALLFILVWSKLRDRNFNVFKREIGEQGIYNAVIIFIFFLAIIFIDSLVMAFTEKTSFIQILFEIVSALANTGLSTGITAALSNAGRTILTLTMFIGRVGPLIVATAVITKPKKVLYRYAREDVFIG
ncbi:MAG: potassium transporter TrkG [bacterium]|nr:potassium transporter TrkG [bacterium]MDD5755650.1 potassium transporter TrkG [bacterium]